MRIVQVALDVPLSTLFDYSISVETQVKVGQRVRVPFGRKEVVGMVMSLSEGSDLEKERIKSVNQVFNDIPPLPTELLTLFQFCSDYYQHPLGMTAMSALPAKMRTLEPVLIKLDKHFALTEMGKAVDLTSLPKRKVIQHRILQELRKSNLSMNQIRQLSSSAPANLKVMLDLGWVESNIVNQPECHKHTFWNIHKPTIEQQKAIDTVSQKSGYQTFLLHGITGSGKTEVYVQLMQQTLQQGQQVLLLVPEINLTPQLEQYFCSRFPDTELVSLHSGMSDGERMDKWLRAQSGQAQIILGTRLSVFTPIPQLGLILVDEEHDSSFKQQDGLRYSARDVAIFRANQHDIPIVLGSATPSLESYYNAISGRYQMLKLNQRAATQARLPDVRCINTNNVPMQSGISPALNEAISERLNRKEQSLLFINRRGYAPVLMCTSCGWLSNCENCAGKLVLHLKDRRLRCHHCGHQERIPHACPGCGNTDLQPVGLGTQRIEETLQTTFPEARILRVDRDSTRNKGSWIAMRKKIQDESVDILVGTQILAKGHDFPNLTLVGLGSPGA